MSSIPVQFSKKEIEEIKQNLSLTHLSDEDALQQAWDRTMTVRMSPAYFSKQLSTLRTQKTLIAGLTIKERFVRFYEWAKCSMGFYF